jgi:peptidoglycan/xylan/chitin deacetylase (PgdA/CDA1 family)
MVRRAHPWLASPWIALLALMNVSLVMRPPAPPPSSPTRTAGQPKTLAVRSGAAGSMASAPSAPRPPLQGLPAAAAVTLPRLPGEEFLPVRPGDLGRFEADLIPPAGVSTGLTDALGATECRTPQSLMLHSAFGVARMEALADAIQASSLRTMTYRQVLEGLRRGECPPENAIIVSLDDLGTNWLRPVFRDMIRVFTDRGLTLVVAVVAQSPGDPAVWEYLRSLEDLGVEVASHTVDHLNLPWVDADQLEHQVVGSYEVLCAEIGRCPVTLILPFGNRDHEGRVMAAASEYVFVVGIARGLSFAGNPPYYLGRIGPDINSTGRTLNLLENTFTR